MRQAGRNGKPRVNFNTANQTFRQLMGNGLSYRVPSFQRDYSWNVDEWDDLWQDIEGLFGEASEPAHYMGYLVLQSEDNKAFDIIDGQQRMTTLSLLMLAAIARLMELATPDDPKDPQFRRAEQLRGNYIGYLDPVSLVPSSKLNLNRHGDGFYQNYLVPLEQLPRSGLNPSEHLLRRSFLWFKERMKQRPDDSGEAIARFIDTVVDKLFFTVITVTDELNAFTVFETLNARGVRLSTTDLLKNYLFALVARDKANESELGALENRWEGIVGLLGSESFPEFLRVFWNSRNKLARKSDLFKTIRNAIDNRAKAFALIRDLDRQARVYAALRNPETSGWPAPVRNSLKELQMFNVRQPLAVLLAAHERLGQEGSREFQRFLRAITTLSFRYNVICSRLANEQERLYNDIAVQLNDGRIANAAQAVQALRPLYPEDGEFRTAFADKTLRTTNNRNKRIVRFILFRMEAHLSSREFDIESAKYNIEHVLPENPDEGWPQFDDRQHEAFVYRLGNLTLLETAANRNIGNAGYEQKRPVLEASELQVSSGLAQRYDSWTVDEIQARQNWMARQATSIWQVQF